jgi:molybdopterin-dependent oxidoreductase alpha subunit
MKDDLRSDDELLPPASDQLDVQPKDAPAGGLGAITSSLRIAWRETGLLRGARAISHMNQEGGFDCPGCAWPEPTDRATVEWCENGAKALAHEATKKRVGPEFFAEWPISKLAEQSDYWLEQQGRLTHPMWKPRGDDHYVPIEWDDLFRRLGEALRALASPNEAIFYTSGRTSNEAAFLYQLFVREYGTNNLPDCSNMCHESSGTGLGETIGIGKGTVGLEDFDLADAIFVIGQNPGTNHPRMMTTLERAKRRGATIVSVNPLAERALVRFTHPQAPHRFFGGGTPISDLFLRVRTGGDVHLLKGIQKEVLAAEERNPGRVLDAGFLRDHTSGFEEWREALARVSWDEIVAGAGVSREEIARAAEIYVKSERVIVCWAMGLTQHRHGVANVQEIVNLLLLRGNIGKPGAGPCPVRGHSNVQGDRTMGIYEKPKPAFLERLGREFGFTPPAAPGFDTVAAIHAMAERRAKVFFALGGNFSVATPDTAFTWQALRRCAVTAQVSTKLNRSHLVTGEEAYLLPCLARSDRDTPGGKARFVTVEDSMSLVHSSQGHLPPPSEHLLSEPEVVARLAKATLGERSTVPWEELGVDYDRIRDRIARVIPGFEDFNRRVREPGGFRLPSGARERRFETVSGKASFTVLPLPDVEIARGELRMMTIRSHDQFNTTIYGLEDRYRGISGDRRVVLMNRDDMAELGLAEGQRVDLENHTAGRERRARGFRVVGFDVPRGVVATYFPEANVLVPVESFAEKSHTPAYKSVPVTIRPA